MLENVSPILVRLTLTDTLSLSLCAYGIGSARILCINQILAQEGVQREIAR